MQIHNKKIIFCLFFCLKEQNKTTWPEAGNPGGQMRNENKTTSANADDDAGNPGGQMRNENKTTSANADDDPGGQLKNENKTTTMSVTRGYTVQWVKTHNETKQEHDHNKNTTFT